MKEVLEGEKIEKKVKEINESVEEEIGLEKKIGDDWGKRKGEGKCIIEVWGGKLWENKNKKEELKRLEIK